MTEKEINKHNSSKTLAGQAFAGGGAALSKE